MDLEILEALALSEDRSAALQQLLPGSEDHDYYACLHAQHRGDLDVAQTILEAWPGRHGGSERLQRLELRQLLYRLSVTPADVADDVRDHFGVSHWHEAEVDEIDPKRPTRLPAGAFDGNSLLAQAIDQSSDLSHVTDDGIEELLEQIIELDTSRRRALLQRIGHSPKPRLVQLVQQDLDDHSTFGALRAHGELTRVQLEALAKRLPRLLGDLRWVDAMVRRMRPPAHVDLEQDRAAREAYIAELWQFVAPLPSPNNSLKAHVLWHLLDGYRRRDAAPPRELVIAYLKLPRAASFLPSALVDNVRSTDVVQHGADYRGSTGLSPAGSDEVIIRDLVHRDPAEAAHYAKWLETSWLTAEIATAHLLYGSGNADKATHTLGPSRAAELRERVDVVWSPHNPPLFGAADPIVLDAEIKHVPELVIKVFRIDPLAYFQHHRREVNTDLDLDGLAASHELVMTFSEPAIRRVRRRIELPMCTRPGTYVIDLIGNGMSSRTVVYKGRLRSAVRIGAAGHVVTVLDEAGQPRPDARAWIGDREYRPDDKGTFVVPFSTAPGAQPMLLACGDIATVRTIELVRETYVMIAEIHVDRQALAEGATARATARVWLSVAGTPASLALLEQPRWDITLTDRHGVATTKSYPLELSDEDAAILELPLGESPASIAISVRGKVRIVSEQRDEELVSSSHVTLATMHGTLQTEALYLARTANGWVLSALGKSGEPRAQRPITVTMTHRWAHLHAVAELATDAHGRCELGALPGIARIMASIGGTTQTWHVLDGAIATGVLHVAPDREALIPLPPGRNADEAIRRSSLVELRGGLPFEHAKATLVPLEGAIAIRGLTPGEYAFRTPGCPRLTLRVPQPGISVGNVIVAPTEVIELSRTQPVLADLAVGDTLRMHVLGSTTRTRVHVIATRFFASPVPRQSNRYNQPGLRADRPRAVAYVSGRELGDEYRYVLERRNAKRFPSLQLDKPSLLLNPWARRTTTTDVAVARAGGVFMSTPAPAMASGYGGRPQAQAHPVDEDAYAAYDFLAQQPVVLPNLEPGDNGWLEIPLDQLGTATCVTILVEDPAGTTVRRIALAERPLEVKDLRLRLALDPARHTSQNKAIAPLHSGESLVIEDLATAKVHLIDSVDRAHAYLLSLNDDATLREFSFVTRWHALPDSERREIYSKYACHELHLFLHGKDRAFFDAVVRPYLAHKRTKTFIDHYLLDTDLTPYLEPWRLAQLNAVERALLAQRLRDDPALVRILGDAVDIQPPDPGRDTRLIDALLGASRLDADSEVAELKQAAYDNAFESEEPTPERMMEAAAMAPRGAAYIAGPRALAAAAPPPAPKAKKAAMRSRQDAPPGGMEIDAMLMDIDRRREEPPMFRAADRTQEWAENNWWHRTPAQSQADMIEPSRLWRDLAQHRSGPFLSPWLGLATTSFAEAMCALAVTDLPLVAGKHTIRADGPRLTIAAVANALAGSSQLVEGPLVEGGPPLVVGQSYVRTDDRYRFVDGEQIDKYVDGTFIAGVVYTCQVVLANPSSTRQRIAALIQIPKGALALAGARQTHTLEVLLDPYGTHGHEYAFYFPSPGRYSHFPVHVSRGGAIVAAAPGRVLEVTASATVGDPHSWAHVSQRGTLADVVGYLATQNLADIELDAIAWRMQDRAAYDAILAALETRHVFDETLWGYALLHHDRARLGAWLRALGDRLLEAGPVLDMPLIGLDAEAVGGYEHLEYSPLTNARAHRLGAKHRILNEGLAGQYQRFLDLVAHRRAPTPADLLAAAAYLLAQDRYDDARASLARVEASSVAERMQYDYVAAYAACLVGDVTTARELASRWRQLPVDRWRRRFEALAAMLAELEGAVAAIVDPNNREQQQAELAAKQPAFDIAVDRDGVIVRQQHVASLELRFFVMDVELLFSRQPFVQSDVSRFSFIEPGHREQLTNVPPEQRVAWPAALRGKNVVVEAVGAGQRKAKIHYANDLATNLSHQYGQVRVQRASDAAALAATYVKVYAKRRGGDVSFYKDGYTDLRGWFDYATLSTNDLDHVERFAILVCSDESGAAILEASPPAR